MARLCQHVAPARRVVLVLAAVVAASTAAKAQDIGNSPVRGWLEHAQIEPSGISLDAKLDTGARTSSIRAEILRPGSLSDDGRDDADAPAPEAAVAASGGDEAVAGAASIEVIEDESQPDFEEVEVPDAGDDTIVFRITNEQGETSTLQRPVVRYVEIKNRDGTTERRPVVEIEACVAGVRVSGEVNLADREDFNYPFLVGRNMLEASGVIVDSRQIYTRSVRCAPAAQ